MYLLQAIGRLRVFRRHTRLDGNNQKYMHLACKHEKTHENRIAPCRTPPTRMTGCGRREDCANRNGAGSAEPADKPGSVVDSHSSRRRVTATLKQPTRTRHGPCHGVPIWPCSGWGLPCRSVAGLAVRSCRTVSPLPRLPTPRCRGAGSVRRSALCCTFRRLAPPRRYLASCPVEPGLSSLHQGAARLSGRLRRQQCNRQRTATRARSGHAGPADAAGIHVAAHAKISSLHPYEAIDKARSPLHNAPQIPSRPAEGQAL